MFKTVFEDWKLKDWKNLPAPVLKILRNFLFENGVYTKIDNGSIAVKLENLIALDDAPEFPPDEIQKWLSKGKNFNSFYHPTNINNYNPIATNSKSQLQNIPRKNLETGFETPDLAKVPVYNEQSRSGLNMPGAYWQLYITEWKYTTFRSLLNDNENTSKSRLDILEMLFDKLRKIQRCLPKVYHSDLTLRDQLINACESIPECDKALFRPAPTSEGVCAELRNAIRLSSRHGTPTQFPFSTESQHDTCHVQNEQKEDRIHYTDRQYGGQLNRRAKNENQRIFQGRKMDYSDKQSSFSNPSKRSKI
ncbi:hypothetical protein Golomagni_04768 [Golovinomyces magnicellulatus]|nr:hypothetical protein Golomagni_04768 [Golovinomyces magnicellulatus]